MQDFNKPIKGNAPIICGSEVARITRERKALEYKQRRDNKKTKRWVF